MKHMYNNNKESLRILQWNAKSILPRVTELSKNFEGSNIILISETWLTAKKQFIIRGFDTVRKDRIDRMGGGVAILISNGVKYKRIMDIYECVQIVDSPMCVRCDVEETPNHVFWGCIGYEEQRKVFQKALVDKGPPSSPCRVSFSDFKRRYNIRYGKIFMVY